ncbi:MAG: hypothetical protein WCS69_11010 [Ignavibacteriaceae bacterium]
MKVSRKKFFISMTAVIVTGAAILSNPIKYFIKQNNGAAKIKIKENPNAVKRNSTGALHG